MPDIVIPITDTQQAKLTAALTLLNENRASQNPPLPPLTQAQWAAQALKEDVDSGSSEAESGHIHRLIVAYQKATPQQRQQVRAILIP